jgi:putative PIN family toxin of toxin-antitoxin system
LLSLPVLTEFNEVFSRKRFDKYLLEEERVLFLAALVREAELVEITKVITACRDPKDDKFLELAVCGNASLSSAATKTCSP